MSQPNLFRYATSELSQDAFICWLLAWASPEYKYVSSELHDCGTKLIGEFFKKHGTFLPVIEKVEVKKQYSNIDILCIVNDEFAVLIEDKTRTKNHSGQLAKYLSIIEDRYKGKVIPIYFKKYDQSCYKNVEKNEYKVFARSDFLSILNFGDGLGISNAIFQNFREYLQAIEDSVQSYSTTAVSEWNRNAWVGFYLKLQEELEEGNWDYVPNRSGGFQGFWWSFQGNENCKQYLQLEESKLCFKIKVGDPSKQKELRSKWYNLIKSEDSDLNIAKPKSFGKGKWMTVMEAKEDYRKVKSNGYIDIKETVSYLREAKALLCSVSKTA